MSLRLILILLALNRNAGNCELAIGHRPLLPEGPWSGSGWLALGPSGVVRSSLLMAEPGHRCVSVHKIDVAVWKKMTDGRQWGSSLRRRKAWFSRTCKYPSAMFTMVTGPGSLRCRRNLQYLHALMRLEYRPPAIFLDCHLSAPFPQNMCDPGFRNGGKSKL